MFTFFLSRKLCDCVMLYLTKSGCSTERHLVSRDGRRAAATAVKSLNYIKVNAGSTPAASSSNVCCVSEIRAKGEEMKAPRLKSLLL